MLEARDLNSRSWLELLKTNFKSCL